LGFSSAAGGAGARRRREQALDGFEASDLSDDDDDTLPGWMVDAAPIRPDELVEQAVEIETVNDLSDALPGHHRDVMRMAIEHELDVREIADWLDIPAATVKSQLHYARRPLPVDWMDRLAHNPSHGHPARNQRPRRPRCAPRKENPNDNVRRYLAPRTRCRPRPTRSCLWG
jgi:hypothetical protein